MPDTAATLTKQGITRHAAGETAAAAELFVQAIQIDAHYEMAWLWLSSCLSAQGEKRYCLDRALAANPQSVPAQKGLAQMDNVAPMRPTVLGSEIEIPIAPPAELSGPGLFKPALPVRAIPAAPHKKRTGCVIGVGIALLVLIGIGIAAVALFPPFNDAVRVALGGKPSCMASLPAFNKILDPLAREWDDANALANSTPRASLAGQISNLQSVRRRVQDLETPECGAAMKQHLIASMDATIDGYVAFLTQKSDSEVQRHFTTASTEMTAYQTAIFEALVPPTATP